MSPGHCAWVTGARIHQAPWEECFARVDGDGSWPRASLGLCVHCWL